ncbi:hypothetical protein KY331_01015 [Candidatus Woesearchaeota archaeon]|nr:hypothetical protein [Candidatus Woesearchaeota archaeon]
MISGIEIKRVGDFLPRPRYLIYLVEKPENSDNYIPLEGLVDNNTLLQLREREIGNLTFYYNKQVLLSTGYFPFGSSPTPNNRFLLGKGIADRIDLIVADDLLELFGEDDLIIFNTESKHRQDQLKRQGIELGRKYTLKEYYEIINSNIGILNSF